MLPRAANEETFAEQEIIMFLKKFRNIFASLEANFASAKNASKGSSIGVGGTRSFCKNDLIPIQLHTTLHLMAFIFLISYFQSHILGNLYVLYFCESMPWRGRMDPTQNLF